MKTSELTGDALDWAVARCIPDNDFLFNPDPYLPDENGQPNYFTPSTNWAQGGPIIEREGIAIDCIRCDGAIDGWIAALPMFCEAEYEEPAPTPLIAAMRCYVASRMGDEIEIPAELEE